MDNRIFLNGIIGIIGIIDELPGSYKEYPAKFNGLVKGKHS
jgi:hypothetical protein